MEKYKKIAIIMISIIVIAILLTFIYFKVAFIGKNNVKDVVVNDINANKDDVYFESIDLELDKNYYDVEVYYQNKEYEYKVDAKSGKIIYTNFYNSKTPDDSNSKLDSNCLSEALDIALKHANVLKKDVKTVKCENEYDNSVLVYEIDFIYDNYEYDYKINVKTGEVISFDKDLLYD